MLHHSNQMPNVCKSRGLTYNETLASPNRGCIFQTIPSVLEPWLSTGLHAFAAVRSHRPCTSKACQTLLSSKMLTLVVALLGKSACLFNDQV